MPDTGDNQNNSASAASTSQDVQTLAQSRAVTFDQMDKIPAFSGQDPFYTFADFKKHFVKTAKWLLWSQEDQLYILCDKLTGKAKETIEMQDSTFNSPQEIFECLEKKFHSEKDPGEIFRDFWEFRQTENMPVDEFISQIRKRAERVRKTNKVEGEFANEAKESWIMSVLRENIHGRYKRDMIARNPKTSVEFEEVARNLEKAWVKTREGPPDEKAFAIAPTQDPMAILIERLSTRLEELSTKIDNIEKPKNQSKKGIVQQNLNPYANNFPTANRYQNPSRQQQNRANIICFKCNMRGHYQRECVNQSIPTNDFQQYGNFNPQVRGRSSFRGGYRGNQRGGYRPSQNNYGNNSHLN